MSSQSLNIDVGNEIIVELIEQPLELEAEVSVISAEQIKFIEEIRDETLEARDGAVEAEGRATASANEAANSEIFARQYRDDTLELKEDTAVIRDETQQIHNDTAELKDQTASYHEQTKELHQETESFRDQAHDSATSADQSAVEASDSQHSALGSEKAAQASEGKADEHRQASADSESAAQAAKETTLGARDDTLEARNESLAARDLARRWATEAEDIPVENGEFSSLHWAKIAERFAGTITNGMYFAGSWDLGNGLPPEPDPPGVPWYRVKNTNVPGAKRRLLKDEPWFDHWRAILRQANKGDQLVWDPLKPEWFIIDTSDEVWLVNNKKGNVVLNAQDVGALPETGGEVSGAINVTGLTDRQYRITHPAADYSGEFVVTTNGVFIRKREADGNDPRSIGIQPDGSAAVYDGGWRKIYHEGNKPSPSDIGALANTGNQELSGAIYPKVSEGSADNDPPSWSDGYSLSAATGSSGYSAYAVLNTFRTGSGRVSQQLAYPERGESRLRFRSADPDDDSWLPWAEVYSTTRQPTPAEVGLGNVLNRRQVVADGNNRIQNCTSFVIDGNEIVGDEENVRGVLRIVLSEQATYGAKGTVFLQAGHAQSETTANNGALVFGGYWGGSLHEANFKLLDAKKLTVQVSGSSTRHAVYHQDFKPTYKDLNVLPTYRRSLSADVDLNDLTSGAIYRQGSTANTSLEKNYPKERAGQLFVINDVDQEVNSQTAQLYITVNNGVYFRSLVGGSDPAWRDWVQVYHTDNQPTTSDIGAEPTLAADRKRKITISTSDPSGGSDGDIWFKV